MSGISALGATPEYLRVERIERMPALPKDYHLRDWKAVTRGYIDLVFGYAEGDNLPLSRIGESGFNYSQYRPLYLDTYVGSKNHGRMSEGINTIPAVVSAYLTDNQERTDYPLAEGIINFFNARNGENVYLNGFSSHSGHDWWYDVMPNVYFYQLYGLAEMPDADLARTQYVSVADRWLGAVYALGGDPATDTPPEMGYRAFNLMDGKPLTTGVIEPESAGSIAWLLLNAWQRTGEEKYLKGAELSMTYLDKYPDNPSYELQLAYGVQAAAKMNAIAGTRFGDCRLFTYCFDRGPLRGWGASIGEWGGYSMAGLIGEANDNGNDYVFVMNGFQQAAALAPAVRYDKRLSRAYGRWMVNVASASRYFYPGALPAANADEVSMAWSRQYDKEGVIPFEAIKEKWKGVGPYARGDARQGGWASTNLSLYSGSSVGYMAAVVTPTDVEGILQLDLCATDIDGAKKYPTYLYYNPYGEERNVTLPLADGKYKIYDAVTEKVLDEDASSSTAITIPGDDVRLVTVIPAEAELHREGRRLYAGDTVIDYNLDWEFDTGTGVTAPDQGHPLPSFTMREGKVVCDNPEVEITGVYGADGQSLGAPAPGILTIITYRHGDRHAQAKQILR